MYCNPSDKKMDIIDVCVLFFIICSTILLILMPDDSEASSPAFYRQEIIDDNPSPDLRYSPLTPLANCSIVKHSVQIPDLEGVSYFSDGRSLNSTFWLSSSFEERPKHLVRIPTYSMLIGVIQPFDVNSKVNYKVSISWDYMKQKWIKTTEEFFGNDSRTMEEENITQFFDNSGNNGKINLSLDLSKINFPEKYFVVFSMLDGALIKGNLCMFSDFINQFAIIPPDFGISTYPSQLEIRQDEEKNILLNLTSTKFVDATLYLNSDPPDGFEIHFEPNPVNISRDGIGISHLKMKALDVVQPGPYTFTVQPSVTLPVAIDFDQLFHGDIQNLFTPAQLSMDEDKGRLLDNITKEKLPDLNVQIKDRSKTIHPQASYITVMVTPYSWNERFGDFWNIYGDFISLLGGGFAAGFSALLIDRFKTRSK